MNDMLELALNDLMPNFATEQPDWADVILRSRHAERRPAWSVRRRQRRTLVLAFGALIILVASAVAFAGPVHDLFFGKPAPPIIKQAFRQNNKMRAQMRQWQKAHGLPVDSPPLVEVAHAHGVMATQTTDGLLLLWAAPAKGGGECWFVEFGSDQLGHKHPTGDGSCFQKPAAPSKVRWAYGWSRPHPMLGVLSGRLDTSAVALRVWLRSGLVRTVPVVDRYFLAAFPRKAGVPVRVTALDASGHVVATY